MRPRGSLTGYSDIGPDTGVIPCTRDPTRGCILRYKVCYINIPDILTVGNIDLMWSDPDDIENWAVSPRGAGWLFGGSVTREVGSAFRVLRNSGVPLTGLCSSTT